MKITLSLAALLLGLTGCGGATSSDSCANWSCGGSSQCAAVMGASSGSQCGFTSTSACQAWCNQYIPGNCSCATSTSGGSTKNPTDNLTALQVLPNQSFYACSDTLGSSFMPQTPLAVGGNPTSNGYSWTIQAGQSLPQGLTVQVDASTGIMTGTIAKNVAAGDYPINVTVTDGVVSNTGPVTIHVTSNGGTDMPPYSNGMYSVRTSGSSAVSTCPVAYIVAAPDVIRTMPSVFANQKYGANMFVAGVTNTTWSLQPLYGGAHVTSLPPGLQLNPVNGTIYGAVSAGTAAGNFQFTANAVTSYSGGNEPGNGYSTKGGAACVINVTQ